MPLSDTLLIEERMSKVVQKICTDMQTIKLEEFEQFIKLFSVYLENIEDKTILPTLINCAIKYERNDIVIVIGREYNNEVENICNQLIIFQNKTAHDLCDKLKSIKLKEFQKLIIKYGHNFLLAWRDQATGHNLLMQAIVYRREDIVSYLLMLRNEDFTTLRDNNACNLLHLAAAYGNYGIFEEIVNVFDDLSYSNETFEDILAETKAIKLSDYKIFDGEMKRRSIINNSNKPINLKNKLGLNTVEYAFMMLMLKDEITEKDLVEYSKIIAKAFEKKAETIFAFIKETSADNIKKVYVLFKQLNKDNNRDKLFELQNLYNKAVEVKKVDNKENAISGHVKESVNKKFGTKKSKSFDGAAKYKDEGEAVRVHVKRMVSSPSVFACNDPSEIIDNSPSKKRKSKKALESDKIFKERQAFTELYKSRKEMGNNLLSNILNVDFPLLSVNSGKSIV